MKLGIHLHAAGLSLSKTMSIPNEFGITRCHTTVHNWVQKAGLQPLSGRSPTNVAIDETVIQVNSHRYWLVAAVDPDTNRYLHVRLYPIRNQGLIQQFLT